LDPDKTLQSAYQAAFLPDVGLAGGSGFSPTPSSLKKTAGLMMLADLSIIRILNSAKMQGILGVILIYVE
jgi:hypothetical protein